MQNLRFSFAPLVLLGASICITSIFLGPVCVAQASGSPAESTMHTLRGTVSYRQRLALPPDAVVQIIIEDVSHAGGAPESFAEEDVPTRGHQVPIKFEVKYDPAGVNPEHRYQIRAKITSDGRLMFTSTALYPVLTHGAPADRVAIDLEQVSAQYGQVPSEASGHLHRQLTGTQWTLTELNGKGPENDTPQAYIKLDDKTGRIEGSGACNRLMGSYEVNGHALHFKQVATTMMACPGDVTNQEHGLLAALGETESYHIHNSTLTLLGRDAKVLARFEAQDAATQTTQ